ncbi:aminoglycoside phosphotransferase family protein [Algihabitans albus]|uniref:phosphotransferase family protein n=1 Tax=Algihabitans albus TaxID=2164067 RepID=UPI0035CEDEBE
MISPPVFASTDDYVTRLGDTGFWTVCIAAALERHGLADDRQAPVAGFNATYPTFVCGDAVVKLFGHFPPWRRAHSAERAAYRLLVTDPEIAAPRLLGEGNLFDDPDRPWPYLITGRMPGIASGRAKLSADERLALAVDLGRQVRRLHALPIAGRMTQANWTAGNLSNAMAQSSLPPHLAAQTETYLARLTPFDRVFSHGDITANHVFVAQGCFTGIIDWGDAMVTDRHYELIQLYRDLFQCDKALFRTFLEASDWPVGKDFAQKALGLALYRQTIGAAQHHTMDVFQPIAARFPLQDIATLDELATELFEI